MTIHKEGFGTISIVILLGVIGHLISHNFLYDYPAAQLIILIASILLLIIVLQFFRHPRRKISPNEKHVLAPADGKVVVIEQTNEPEFLKDRRIQISIFMSPINVHVNRYPVAGKITYCRYHPGMYHVAWHPKSSTENERTTVVVETKKNVPILVRQIAGALARRIVCYPKQDWIVKQGEEMGFIKFGSRVDVFLPLNAKIVVDLNAVVIGGKTVLAEID